MSESTSNQENAAQPLFGGPPPERSGFPAGLIFGATTVVLVILGALLLASRGHHAPPAGTILALDPQSGSLPLSNMAMSESTSLSGGKLTFIDGHIRNATGKTVTGITVQVLFRNDLGLAPQAEVLPLQLIRSRQPYIDSQPVSAAPLAPGDERDFRLPFENINENWNIQIPEIRIVGVTAR